MICVCNSFDNVNLVVDATRVKLIAQAEEGSDYINANYLPVSTDFLSLEAGNFHRSVPLIVPFFAVFDLHSP